MSTMDNLTNSEEIVDGTDPLNSTGLHTYKLSIVSYGHANGPFVPSSSEPAELLIFSVRDIKNPPVKLRKKHTGLSSRLQTEIFAKEAARMRLDAMSEALEAKIVEMSEVDVEAKPTDQQSSQSLTASKLFVGIMCEEGKHRSVAFAEELARKIKTRASWAVSVEHRDLGISTLDAEDGHSGDESLRSKTTRKSKKQREQERRRGRSMAGRFFPQEPLGDED